MYKVGTYLRLSRDDGDKYESDSISSQRDMINKYINDNTDLILFKEYSDDGFSGTNFDRPSFIQMIQDIEDNKIDCVIVKDLSRFGRDYIETGRYLERFFPEKNIRFIAINDNIDSMKQQLDILVPIKNIFNENYARDISKKVSTSLRTKQEQGEFIGSFASYGYKKNPLDKHKLIIDEYAASIVRKIYKMFVDGMSKQKIANQLNEDGILCPSAYKMSVNPNYINGRAKNNKYAWSYNTIMEILTKEIYIGNMCQRIQKSNGIRSRGKKTDKDERIIVKNTHEPIIDLITWNKVQSLINKNKSQSSKKGEMSALSGFLICGDCGKKMVKYYTYFSNDKKVFYFACASYRRYGKSVCTKHTVRYEYIENLVLNDLNKAISKITDLKKLADQNKKNKIIKYNPKNEIEKTNIELSKVNNLKMGLYEDYKEGLITKEEYLQYKDEYTEKENLLTQKINVLSNAKNENDILESEWIKRLIKFKKIEQLDRDLVSLFVKYIKVYEKDKIQIKIKYNFSDELKEILEEE